MALNRREFIRAAFGVAAGGVCVKDLGFMAGSSPLQETLIEIGFDKGRATEISTELMPLMIDLENVSNVRFFNLKFMR